MPIEARATKASAWQAVSPDHDTQLGADTGANHDVTNGAATHSGVAPRAGLAVVSIPADLTVRVRVGLAAVATATDQAYFGPTVHHFPIREGWRISLWGDGAGGTCTISMAQ